MSDELLTNPLEGLFSDDVPEPSPEETGLVEGGADEAAERAVQGEASATGDVAALVDASEAMPGTGGGMNVQSAEVEIEQAARIMRDHKIKKLLATRHGQIEGIITSFDMIVAEPVIKILAKEEMM